MASGRKNTKLFANSVNQERGDSTVDSDEEQTWSALPIELLEQCLSQLSLKDNICASAVCKRWLAVAISVRKANKPPWLMCVPRHGDLCEFYDPSCRKKYWHNIPELKDAELCYAKDGWLLMVVLKLTPTPRRITELFLFCPYTREMIKLPAVQRLEFQMIVFSAAPSSPSCLIFTLKRGVGSTTEIRTCHPGDKKWSITIHESHPAFDCTLFDKIVFSNGQFCCLSGSNIFGVYNPNQSSWSVRYMPIPEWPVTPSIKSWYNRKFMAEHGGDFYVVNCSCIGEPIIFKLDLTNMAWIRIETLGDVTLFVSFFSSHAVTDLLGTMRNSVYFPKVLYHGKRCIQYSLDEARFFPGKDLDYWVQDEVYDRIWIEAPEDLSFLNEG